MMNPNDPRHIYPMTWGQAFAAWPCAMCDVRRDEHADQDPSAPLAITDHSFAPAR